MNNNVIVVKPFKHETIVVCGYCKGTGTHTKSNTTCEYCSGEKFLKRVTEGKVSVYKIKM